MVATTGHLTLKDIAELAQVSRPAVSNWRKRYSDFPAPLETSAPNKPLFEAADVVSWLKANELLPEDTEEHLQLTSLWAAANLLRNEIAIDDIPLIMLTLLAIDKDPVFKPSAEFDALSSRISTAKLEEVQQAISRLHLADHGKAAQLVVDRFLGIGSVVIGVNTEPPPHYQTPRSSRQPPARTRTQKPYWTQLVALQGHCSVSEDISPKLSSWVLR